MDKTNNCSHPQMCPEKEPYFDVAKANKESLNSQSSDWLKSKKDKKA